jgi:hypothetical protein
MIQRRGDVLRKRALAALLTGLALAVVAAGCGGGGDTSGGGETSDESGSAPTKAAFVKEADGICEAADEELNEEIETYAEENGISTKKEPTKPQIEEIYVEVVLPNVARQGEEVDGLTPPEGDAVKVEEIVHALDSGVEEAEANPSLLVEGKNPLEDAGSKAKAYGMKVCGSGE